MPWNCVGSAARDMGTRSFITTGVVARNRKARFNYEILETLEAGLVLEGTEVKALRYGRANIAESYASVEKDGDLYLLNAHIQEYSGAAHFSHEPTRPRKLLVHKRQKKNLIGSVSRKGLTLVPLKLYFNERGVAKLLLGLGQGKQKYDKRQTIKDRDWQRRKARIMREKG